MTAYAKKTQASDRRSINHGTSYSRRNRESTFQFVDNRTEASTQRKLQERASNVRNYDPALMTKQVVQKSDDDSDDGSGNNALGNNVNISDNNNDLISSVWICGSATASQHQEVICVIGSRGFLRFSRNNSSDTAMSTNQARLPIIYHTQVHNVTVGQALTAYSQTHALWPRYDQADCQTFAQEIVFRLTGQHVFGHGEDDDFM